MVSGALGYPSGSEWPEAGPFVMYVGRQCRYVFYMLRGEGMDMYAGTSVFPSLLCLHVACVYVYIYTYVCMYVCLFLDVYLYVHVHV